MANGIIKAKAEAEPTVCPKCKGSLTTEWGFFGERVLVCKIHKMVWGDAEQAEKLADMAEKMVDSTEDWAFR